MELIIVNYHHIDDEDKYKRGIYPVSKKRFKNQIEYLGKFYEFISEKDLVSAINKKNKLPKKSCIITFDDGLRNQYDNAIPILKKHKIPAIFFLNTLALSDKKVCQAHKIHFILSKVKEDIFIEKIFSYIKSLKNKKYDFEKINEKKLSLENRYDNKTTSLLKYLLTFFLDQKTSRSIVDSIFKELCENENKYIEELYLNKQMISEINNSNLFSIGLHTKSHINIANSSEDAILKEIKDNYKYLSEELNIKDIKGLSYPYGNFNKDTLKKTLKQLKKMSLVYAFTMNRDLNENLHNPLFLNRYDTNDIPLGKRPIISFHN